MKENSKTLLQKPNLDVHVHSPYSACCEDITFEKLRIKGREKNIIYAITDHSTHLYFPRKLAWSITRQDFKDLLKKYRRHGRRKMEEYIERVRKNSSLVGVELDIYTDETLIFEEEFLKELDIVIGAVHFLSSIREKRREDEIIDEFMRLTTALVSSGKIDVLAHPFRILLYENRAAVEDDLIDWVVDICCQHKVALELNSHYKFPHVDLKMISTAIERNCKIVFGSDAHKLCEFGDYTYHKQIYSQAKRHSASNKKNVRQCNYN